MCHRHIRIVICGEAAGYSDSDILQLGYIANSVEGVIVKKSKRLHSVQKLNQMRERDAAKSVGMIRQEVVKEETQLRNLMEYRSEYQAGILVGLKPSGRKLQDFHGFLVNLNVAIEQQEERLQQVRKELEAKITQWEEAHGKVKVMDKLITQYENEEHLIENKNEQKFIDDLPKKTIFKC